MMNTTIDVNAILNAFTANKPANMFDAINLGKALKTEILTTTPNGAALMHGLAGNFVHFMEMLCELVDNAVSNFRANKNDKSLKRVIRIDIEHRKAFVDVSVRDGGTGIEDLSAALTIRQNPNGTTLNEHGFGLKHALASVDPSGVLPWMIRTRTKADAARGVYREVKGPYSIAGMPCEEKAGDAGFGKGTGTAVIFRCPIVMFNTLRPKGKREEPSFEDMIGYIEEELRVTYAPMLAHKEFSIHLSGFEDHPVIRTIDKPLEPKWVQKTHKVLPDVTTDLGGGHPVTISCSYGQIEPSRKNAYYYKGDMHSSGVEVRLNGRLIESSLFEEIWDEKVHNSQNRFLAQVNLTYDERDAAPSTRSSKNGFRAGDPRLDELYRWIRNNLEKPKCDEVSAERRLVKALCEKLEAEPDVLRATMEERAYETLGLKIAIDLFVSRPGNVTIYEAKKGSTKAENLFQLMMYWDGCVRDGKPADTAVLIAARHPKEVISLAAELNRRKDASGRNYNFRLRTWADEGIKPGNK